MIINAKDYFDWSGIKNNDKEKKIISLEELMLNFIQKRADYSTRIMTTNWRKTLKSWFKKYFSLLNVSINWVKIDLNNYKDLKKINLEKSDILNIKWPILIDWLHQSNLTYDKKHKINTRSRFFFEYMSIDVFIISEFYEPWKDSFLRNNNFNNYTNKLNVLLSYDLKSWETLESKLYEIIPLIEKNAFLNVKVWTVEYNNLINYYYWKQIKALQLFWFLENEKQLNKNATNINRVIPYIDVINIDLEYSLYIKDVEKEKKMWV
jgi:hypothetical protein